MREAISSAIRPRPETRGTAAAPTSGGLFNGVRAAPATAIPAQPAPGQTGSAAHSTRAGPGIVQRRRILADQRHPEDGHGPRIAITFDPARPRPRPAPSQARPGSSPAARHQCHQERPRARNARAGSTRPSDTPQARSQNGLPAGGFPALLDGLENTGRPPGQKARIDRPELENIDPGRRAPTISS